MRAKVRGANVLTNLQLLTDAEGSFRRPLRQAAVIGLLLAVATVVDYFTGPTVTPSALYLLAIVTAAWQRGLTVGLLVAILAGALNVFANIPHPVITLGQASLPLNLSFNFLVLVGAAWLGSITRRQQQLLTYQRDQFAQLSMRMDDEMRAARTLQKLLVPPIPQHPAFQIATLVEPARILGGDVLDLTLTPDGRLACALADISGKGSPAALAAAVLIGLLDDAPERFHSPAATLVFLNERLAKRMPESLFVTMFYALLDLKQGKLTYASAGHDPPLLVRGGSASAASSEMLLPTGMVLGALPGEKYTDESVALRPGDLLLLYTDGVTDVIDAAGRRFGPEQLRAVSEQLAEVSAQEAADTIAHRVKEFAVQIPDDISLVAIKFLGSPAGEMTPTPKRARRHFSRSIRCRRRMPK